MRYEEVSNYVVRLVDDELLAWVRKKSLKLRAYGVHPIA